MFRVGAEIWNWRRSEEEAYDYEEGQGRAGQSSIDDRNDVSGLNYDSDDRNDDYKMGVKNGGCHSNATSTVTGGGVQKGKKKGMTTKNLMAEDGSIIAFTCLGLFYD